MSDTVIKVENLSKHYNLGTIGTGTLYRDIQSFWARLRGKEDPNTQIGTWDASQMDQDNSFWALKDVSFEVKQGDVVGIIGRNGAGKSTLLKILSRVTGPTSGNIKIKGRVASLLEVGTGFHPELTGRENVYLNGTILGMRKAEIDKKFDEIVAFAEIEKFIDTPVKRYSSGMYVRLAFAVAAHLDPEILIVDEVLAVGDANFQKKCLGKMGEVSKNGRTVLFVSHNMEAVQSLCSKGILLSKGNVEYDGNIVEVIKKYKGEYEGKDLSFWQGIDGDKNVAYIKSCWVKPVELNESNMHTAVDIEVGVEFEVAQNISSLICGFTLFSEFGYELAYCLYDDSFDGDIETVKAGIYLKRFVIPRNTLAQGNYRINFDLGIHNVTKLSSGESDLVFSLNNVEGIGRRFLAPNIKGRASLFRPAWALPKE